MYKSVRISQKAYDYISNVAKANKRTVIATIDVIVEKLQKGKK